MEKMTAFTDSEYTCLHELDLDGIKERVENCMGSGVMAAKVLEDDAPALIAEVERLREELETSEESSKVRYILLEDAQENIEHLKYVLDMVKNKVSLFGQVSTTKVWNAKHAKGILEFIDHELEEGEPDE